MYNPLSGYNPQQTDDAPSFEPLELGWYPVCVVDIEHKDTAKGGSMISAKCEVTDGPRRGRKVFMNFTWTNNSEMAVKIGHGQFKAFHIACGIQHPKSLDELRFKHLEVKVSGHREYNGKTYEEVDGWRERTGVAPAPQQAAPQQQYQQPAPQPTQSQQFSDAPRTSSTGPWGG